jgi:putative FmdB family regulatory protein
MPIYEYQCQSCDHQFEIMQRISDPVMKTCPECGKRKLKKLVSAVAFRLKGGGWYETDFKSGDKKKNVHGSDSDEKPAKEKTDGAQKKATDGAKKESSANEKGEKSAKASKSTKPKKGSSD